MLHLGMNYFSFSEKFFFLEFILLFPALSLNRLHCHTTQWVLSVEYQIQDLRGLSTMTLLNPFSRAFTGALHKTLLIDIQFKAILRDVGVNLM